MTFRERLRERIKFCGLLDKEVAAMAGISKRTLDSYVGSESCMPSAEIAVRFARTLEVSVEYLITGEITPAENTNSEVSIINLTTDSRARNLLHHFTKLSERDQNLLLSFASIMENSAEQV